MDPKESHRFARDKKDPSSDYQDQHTTKGNGRVTDPRYPANFGSTVKDLFYSTTSPVEERNPSTHSFNVLTPSNLVGEKDISGLSLSEPFSGERLSFLHLLPGLFSQSPSLREGQCGQRANERNQPLCGRIQRLRKPSRGKRSLEVASRRETQVKITAPIEKMEAPIFWQSVWEKLASSGASRPRGQEGRRKQVGGRRQSFRNAR